MLHDDHRTRVRESFLQTGIEGFSGVQVLELLLFYAIPRRDTNEIAHRLLERFGSLNGVLSTSPKDLQAVEGIGESASVLLNLVMQLTRRVLLEQAVERRTLNTPQETGVYAQALFVGERSEKIYLICLDNGLKLLGSADISRGSPNAAILDNRAVLEAAFRMNAANVVLTHNHPSGEAVPSEADIQATAALANLLRSVGIPLLDHWIVAGAEAFSLAGHSKFKGIF
jgi:DNA repair protein RadC